MLSSNAKYIQYKITKPSAINEENEEDEEEEEKEEEEEEKDYNNNISYYNYKKLKQNERKTKYFRRKTFNFILKYLLLITFFILIIEIFVYLKYFRKQTPQLTQQQENLIIESINNVTMNNYKSSTIDRGNGNNSGVNITSSFNYTTIKLIDYKEDLIEQEDLIKYKKNDAYFNSFFNSIKQIQIETYKKQNIMINLCPAIPPSLEGLINFTQLFNNTNLADLITFYENISPNRKSDNLISTNNNNNNNNDDVTTNILKFNSETDNLNLLNENKIYGTRVSLGGYWKPPDCLSRSKIAIIIPYRDRFVHLAILLRNLHLILQRQLIDYRIFVTEQFGNKSLPFNKGRIMNAAFLEALKIDQNFQCFIFHDVDLILEDDRNMYTCPQFPRHMSVAIDKFKYNLPYYYLIGGVFQLKTEHFRLANGYSNR